MNKLFILLFSAMLFTACGKEKITKKETASPAENPVELGQKLFEGEGNCFACHKPDQKIIAPSLQEIAKIYKQQNADMVSFLKGEGQPIVDPSQYEIMKTNFSITKNMSDDQLKALETYIMSFAKP
jgi:cytochrome c